MKPQIAFIKHATVLGGMTMRAQKAGEMIVGTDHRARIEQMQSELAALNKRLEEVEKTQADAQTLESLKQSAIRACKQIDEARCAMATDHLVALLAK
ncbi:hypothetical protein AS156_15020 [Bradyrhizobium macuxiense]|uniref:Uncharacterized protein n=1 Tax=Bradyrhizobium macuxiense TaxID=1755647 RepID=A0A109JJ76_9BRAD|nr:hypothetical protein [Bradyrhizobium macuxiense]KWV49839.1 hypothetical protein AS156_15020 [Bradyrhizobium macuxiense]